MKTQVRRCPAVPLESSQGPLKFHTSRSIYDHLLGQERWLLKAPVHSCGLKPTFCIYLCSYLFIYFHAVGEQTNCKLALLRMPLLHIPPLERQRYTLVKNLEEFIYQLKTNRKWDLTRWKNILLYTDQKMGQ